MHPAAGGGAQRPPPGRPVALAEFGKNCGKCVFLDRRLRRFQFARDHRNPGGGPKKGVQGALERHCGAFQPAG